MCGGKSMRNFMRWKNVVRVCVGGIMRGDGI